MLSIFISYGRKDAKDLALSLAKDLRLLGYAVWLDLDEIPSGGSFTQDLERAIDACDAMLVLISHAGMASSWCRAEQMRAVRKGKTLIPLLVQTDAEPPIYLEHLNYLDFTTPTAYAPSLNNLVSDLTASHAFRVAHESKGFAVVGKKGVKPTSARASGNIFALSGEIRRNAPAFRRHIKALRAQKWMGGRYWWAYFAFFLTDVHDLIGILDAGELRAPYSRKGRNDSAWDRRVRLHFRPRTPHAYHAEGFRMAHEARTPYDAPMPVYLLFDLETLLLLPNAKFSDGDVTEGASTYSTPQSFAELPFDLIYHDGWVRSDEMNEVMRYRKAELIVPERVGLEGLQVIWTRSEAEYETLYHLMNAHSPYLWRKWRDKITPRTDFVLFHNKRAFVLNAILTEKSVRLRFNPFVSEPNASFFAEFSVQYDDGTTFDWRDEAFNAKDELEFALPSAGAYSVTLMLDGELAYTGAYDGALRLL